MRVSLSKWGHCLTALSRLHRKLGPIDNTAMLRRACTCLPRCRAEWVWLQLMNSYSYLTHHITLRAVNVALPNSYSLPYAVVTQVGKQCKDKPTTASAFFCSRLACAPCQHLAACQFAVVCFPCMEMPTVAHVACTQIWCGTGCSGCLLLLLDSTSQ